MPRSGRRGLRTALRRRWIAGATAQSTTYAVNAPVARVASHAPQYALLPSSETALFEAECATLEEEIGSFDAVIAGHCGMAFQRDVGGKSWVNAGTIGLPPHDGRQQTRYAILDQGQVSFHQLDYDAAAAQTAMIAAGLTQGYHESLMSGYWPSEDILPKQYRRAC